MDVQLLNKNIGQKLWKFRLYKKMSRAKLAQIIGISQQQYEKYEKGKNRISAATLAVIMHHLQIHPSYFFAFSDLDKKGEKIYEEMIGNFAYIENSVYGEFMLSTLRLLRECQKNWTKV